MLQVHVQESLSSWVLLLSLSKHDDDMEQIMEDNESKDSNDGNNHEDAVVTSKEA